MIHPEAASLPTTAISPDELQQRRDELRQAVGTGLILIPGQSTSWRNPDNPFPFRQSSHLLYLAPVHRPGLMLLLDADSGRDILFGPPDDPDDVVWHGPHPTLEDEAAAVGVADVRPVADLTAVLGHSGSASRQVHLPPISDAAVRREVAHLLSVQPEALDERISRPLVRALGNLRLKKSASEIRQIEAALEVTAGMFTAAMEATRPGIPERAVYAEMARAALESGLSFSFSPIVTVRGEVLHNQSYDNMLEEGDLLLVDAGLETAAGYASDISRTFPVSGSFDTEQQEIYQVVLAAELAAIAEMVPGVNFQDVHSRACRVIARGLTEIGLMRGDPAEAVAAGAHALFFVHGLGHPLGLDTHDLHDLGDDVAYPDDRPRSTQFGTRFLRFGRDLDEGMVMTVEPGIYFIPELIDRWRAEGRHRDFIDYERVEQYRNFGGIRIEDDVLCTGEGTRILGPAIPKFVPEVEAALNS